MKGHPSYVYKTSILTENNKRNYEHIVDTQWAYLAGIIDGEGCIFIRASDYRGKRGIRNVYYCLTVTVGNTSASMIKWLHEIFKGSRITCRGETVKNKTVWGWTVASQEAEEICRGILPYLTAKKDQAELALMFRETYRGYRMRSKKPVNPETVELRRLCYEEMKALKQRRQVL